MSDSEEIKRRLSELHPDEIFKKLVEAGENWADAKATRELLDGVTKSVLAQIADDLRQKAVLDGNKPVEARIESDKYLDDRWVKHSASLSDAIGKELKARVRYESMNVWCDLMRSFEATARHEQKLSQTHMP